MVVTDMKTENVKPVRGRQVFLSHESLYDRVEFFNDSTFWQQYNIIEPTESLEKGIERLKKKTSPPRPPIGSLSPSLNGSLSPSLSKGRGGTD